MVLPKGMPFRDVFNDALDEYQERHTYWYVPKARSLNDANVDVCAQTLNVIFNEFLGETWNHETQDALLSRLVEEGIHRPTAKASSRENRTALSRITKVLFGTLGFLWVDNDKEVFITDAGFAMVEALANDSNPRPIVEAQVAKLQYPNPNSPDFGGTGILPHLFLLQILQKTGYYLTFEEYELFVNLAQEQGDVSRVLRYVMHWRDLSGEDKNSFREVFKAVPMKKAPSASRFRRINLSSSYQRSFFCYPSYLNVDSKERVIRCNEPERVDTLVQEQLDGLKITTFETKEDWFAYFGDPEQRPSWFTYLALAVQSAESSEEVVSELEQHRGKLSVEETAEIARLEVEKAIESSYAEHSELLSTLEQGLRLEGRQVVTPIGRIDLLCRGLDGMYVVVEIKAGGAEDSVFGQILRYIGWIHRNYDDGQDNVRGIILAKQFSDKARYSRIGLLKPDFEEFLQFRHHCS